MYGTLSRSHLPPISRTKDTKTAALPDAWPDDREAMSQTTPSLRRLHPNEHGRSESQMTHLLDAKAGATDGDVDVI